MAKENRLDEYAEQLDVFIEKRKLDLNNSIALINNPKITVTDVAKELNINRSTIHRNKELTDRIEKANEEFGLKLPESDEYQTIGGLILHEYQSFPKMHETIAIGNFQFKIIKVTSTKIELVKLKVNK